MHFEIKTFLKKSDCTKLFLVSDKNLTLEKKSIIHTVVCVYLVLFSP